MSNRLLASETGRLRRSQPFGQPVPTWSMIRTAWRRYRSRQRIETLDRHALKDIGVSFAEAEMEANKPFWRP